MSHLREDHRSLQQFSQSAHWDGTALACDSAALSGVECLLSPAVCCHWYSTLKDSVLPAPRAITAIGKCFRYESTNLTGLERLWDFTMREVVFLGSREHVLERRTETMDWMSQLLVEHDLAGEIRTASDPFFVAPDAVSKTYFQLSSETKFEVSLLLPNDERLAVGSHNYHSDFFGKAFNTTIENHGAMHSVCMAFGLERWVYAFLQQHGKEIARWPAAVRSAPEFQKQRS